MLMLMCGDVKSCPGPDHYNIEELHNLCKQRGLVFVHQNIRGLSSNFESLCALIDSHPNIDVITLSETHLSRDENIDLYKINGYDLIVRSRGKGEMGGGVAVYIRTDFNLGKMRNFGERID